MSCPNARLDPFREQRAELVRLESEIDFAALRGKTALADELCARAHILRGQLREMDRGLASVGRARRDDGPCPDCGGTGWRTRLRRGSSYHDTQEVVGRCSCAAGRRLPESKEG